MTQLRWDTPGEKYFETGVDKGVLYVDGSVGVPWVGLVSVSDAPSGGDAKPYYIDGVRYLNLAGPAEYSGTLEAYTYPDEFEACDGAEQLANGLKIQHQKRKEFGLSYRTMVGNDIDGQNHAYKIHLIYNVLASASDKQYRSLNDEVELNTFSWDLSTRHAKFVDDAFGTRIGSHLILDSRVIYPWALQAVEQVLYGTETEEPRLPTPRELLDLFIDNALLKILDNGDGTWTATGPDTIITEVSRTTSKSFTIDQATGFVTPAAGTTIADPDLDGLFTWTTTGGLRESSQVPGIFLNEAHTYFEIDWPSVVIDDANNFHVSSL